MNNPDYQTINLPYATKDDRNAAGAFIADMVERGLGFNANLDTANMVIRISFTGGF